MLVRLSFVCLSAAILLSAGPKKTSGSAHGENEDLALTVTLYIDPAEIKELVGSDLGGHFFVADVKVEPKYGKEITLDRDDFVLRTDKDGEHTRPYEASQIAGKTTLVVGKTKSGNGSTVESGPTYEGMPMPPGGPMMYPDQGTMIGGGGSGEHESNKASLKTASSETPDPLEKVLDNKILPQKKTGQPISGLLYFPMEKQKLKDLQLLYGDKENRITLRFK